MILVLFEPFLRLKQLRATMYRPNTWTMTSFILQFLQWTTRGHYNQWSFNSTHSGFSRGRRCQDSASFGQPRLILESGQHPSRWATPAITAQIINNVSLGVKNWPNLIQCEGTAMPFTKTMKAWSRQDGMVRSSSYDGLLEGLFCGGSLLVVDVS